MRIAELELSGFRGFSGTLKADLTADAVLVIAANGQGKTSLFDAILWALAGVVPRLGGVKAKLAGFYPADVLDAARWTVGSVSISVPDVTNQFRKIFQDVDNAVTVGHITVFVREPSSSYHWWAHELQHQVQYHQWGIDSFAYKYVTSCHEVESGAEDQAQKAVPAGSTSLGC